jgi:hypothetical protein
MKNLKMQLGDAFSHKLKEELYHFTMAARWWLAYQLSGRDSRVLELCFTDAETTWDDKEWHRLAVFEDGSCINWHEGRLHVYFDVSDLLAHYERFRPDRTTAFDAALLDYPVIEKYRKLLTPDPPNEEKD